MRKTLNRLRSPKLAAVAGLAAYVGLAAWATWPVARDPVQTLPLGDLAVSTVPLFNTWTIWWNADRLLAGGAGYWDAPIFHPTGDTFAFSEPQPLTVIVAPVIWLTGSRVLAANVYLWLSLVLNGVFAWRLLRVLGLRRVLSFAGGAAMLMLPLVHWQSGVLQLVPLWGILWTWTAVVKISRRPTLRRGLELGVAFAVAFHMCVHHALFLAILLAGSTWALWDRWLQTRTWLAFSAAAVIAALLTAPVVIPLWQATERHEFTRERDLVAQLSAKPGDYTAAWGRSWVDFGLVAARPEWTLGVGWLKTGLAVVGIGFGLARRRWRRSTAFLLATTALAVLLSLGPHLQIGGWQPWWTLAEYVPGLAQVRSVFRFAYFVQMAAVLFAAQGLYGVWLLGRRCSLAAAARGASGVKLRWWRSAATVIAAVVALAMVFEVVPRRPHIARPPDPLENAGWIAFVRDQTSPGRAIACLPFAAGNSMLDFDVTTKWMYLGTFHGVPLVNGYSGFFPQTYFDVREAIHQSFPAAGPLEWLADRNVEFLVAQRRWITPEKLDGFATERVAVRRVFSDPVGIDVYRIERLR